MRRLGDRVLQADNVRIGLNQALHGLRSDIMPAARRIVVDHQIALQVFGQRVIKGKNVFLIHAVIIWPDDQGGLIAQIAGQTGKGQRVRKPFASGAGIQRRAPTGIIGVKFQKALFFCGVQPGKFPGGAENKDAVHLIAQHVIDYNFVCLVIRRAVLVEYGYYRNDNLCIHGFIPPNLPGIRPAEVSVQPGSEIFSLL